MGLQFGDVRFDFPGVGDAFGLLCAARATYENTLFARFGEEDVVACRESRRAARRSDESLVQDRSCHQDDIAVEGADRSEVDDRGIGVPGKLKVSVPQEVIVARFQGRGDKPADIDAATGTNEDPIGIDQVDLAVGAQHALDL